MWVLQRARELDSDAGTPVPTVFERLWLEGVEFRFGQLHLVAAAPGVGKSVFALTLALRAKIPTLYFSMDSDATTQYARAAAMVTGEKLATINDAIARKDVGRYDNALNEARHIRFVFDSAPSLDEVNSHVMSFGWAFGQWPGIIIVDNVSNIYSEQPGFQGLEEVMDWLHQLSRKTGAMVLGLHHVVGEYESGDLVVPLSGLRGKISKLPVLIATLNRYWGSGTSMNVAIVKNRAGQAAADGSFSIPIGADLSRMWLETQIPRV
ncbi:DnaB-like helicase C-terminal domain-containing protein [Nonomuraea recticatena]|uniref:SF4 helicase domain-containing protein n=1 Tax=Nonomuraea recticatena TaxID=46178 RepID=A0ABP6FC86_9ACTN